TRSGLRHAGGDASRSRADRPDHARRRGGRLSGAVQRPPAPASAGGRRAAARPDPDRFLSGHHAGAVDEDLPGAARRERRPLRGRGRGNRPALARRLHGRGGGRHLRADDDLLRRRRREARVTPSPLRLAATLLALALLAGAALAAPSKFDGAAALKHVERLVAIGPRVAGTPGGVRAREYIMAEARKITGAQVQARPFEADTPDGLMSMANVVAVLPGARPDVIMVAGHYDTKLFRE